MANILLSELQAWYTEVNRVIGVANSGGTSWTTLSTVSSGSAATAAQINNLKSKIDSIKSDSILGNDSNVAITTPIAVTQYSAINTSIKTNYDTIKTQLTVIKCRNQATNAYGKNSCGANSCGSNSHAYNLNGMNTNGYLIQAADNSGKRTSGYCYSGTCSNTTCSSGTCSNTTCSQGSVIDIRNVNTTA